MRHYFYLDARVKRVNGEYPLKVVLMYKNQRLYASTELKVRKECWDAEKQRVKSHPLEEAYNIVLNRLRVAIDEICLKLMISPSSVIEAKKMLECAAKEKEYGKMEDPRFMELLYTFADSHPHLPTRKSYYSTANRIKAFDSRCDKLTVTDITYEWLKRFDAFMARTAPSANSRSIHMRNIRATFNDAISRDLTTFYPFKRFKIKGQRTPHRALPVEALREIIHSPVLDWEAQYRDLFVLMFLLCGISPVDLCHLKEVRHGLISFKRSKTSEPVEIQVEPEAMEIINRYRGEKYLVKVLERYHAGHSDWLRRMDRNLKTLGGVTMERQLARDGKYHEVTVRKVTWPGLSAYWARHTWASIASSLDIPKETIAQALGHSQRSVTDIYIAFDRTKVFKANRKVIDWVYYGKR